jgi:hypothetical protein
MFKISFQSLDMEIEFTFSIWSQELVLCPKEEL